MLKIPEDKIDWWFLFVELRRILWQLNAADAGIKVLFGNQGRYIPVRLLIARHISILSVQNA
ncbi:hypothetical protein KSU1_D0805 [Candidatus Jettenia caeni]|uniref:Uncharacterized protein n=1 Tax=Candidatus Jettenia caeni TaxID=247490 RepID=I3IQW9_9BACT|nr:hypothetical protein [Candidatus Jettenia caeni]WKZ15470.1 MAG: hypothetical protein QY317_16365 [Candidatus Jettenia caeni]GAB64114.1 hypothetical protein KSU1_D0805 [Candidatus Jettenia caeni]